MGLEGHKIMNKEHEVMKNFEPKPYSEVSKVLDEATKKTIEYVKENELIQYYIVNQQLNMSAGKISAQCSHGSMLMALRDQLDPKFISWMDSIMRKVVLRGKLKDIKKLQEQISGSILITDRGFTEVAPNSETVLVLPIMTREEAKQYVKKLQLL